MSLFKGRSLTRQGLPVVLKRHDFVFIQEQSQQAQMVRLSTQLAPQLLRRPGNTDWK